MLRTSADPAGQDLRPLWRRFRTTRDPRLRDALIYRTVHLVRRIAGRLALRLPPHLEPSDLESAGILGLLAAIEAYDPDRDTEFASYAASRIRGAIIDDLRALDPISRSLRAKARHIERTVRTLQQELLREPTDEEIAARLEVSLDEYHDTLCKLRVSVHASADTTHIENAAADANPAAAAIEHTADPLDQVSLSQRRALLAAFIDQLPATERTVLSLYYHEELTMKEIAAVLDVTEARVSQIHTAAITRLRGRLRQRRLETDDLRIERQRPRVTPFHTTYLAQEARCW
jgi:RNA polymerase sigma factor for flagellar operon FliA